MTDTPGRLLRLLSLLQTPREWPGSELAERLGVSPRTIRRDVERLRDLGYPVEASMGATGGYRLVAGTAVPPLLLEDDEAVAIAVGLRAAAGQAVEGIDEASVRALAKLEQVLPSRLRRRVAVLGAATVPLVTGDAATVDPAHLTALAGAIANRERLRFGYRNGEGEPTRRHVEPHRLVAASRRWYLLAFDVERDDWRVFRLDRLRDPLPTGARFAPREPPADPAEYLTGRFHSLQPTYRTVATLRAPAEEVVRAWGGVVGEVQPLDERTCLLRSRSDTLEWLAFRLTALGCEFEVHEPPELAEHLRALAARASRAAEGV
ncbi:putative DNA-binding transcriptional regulator YafY [Saccharothrix coeruleofusca]|uniref:helix-turn-helix transcriptional regulator n=1 Tax=Saccharothrix coeruleofusca TaxID=33919 RepID=UPI001AE8E836|nr:YafY family protein [Saccharothrix coeruleofusca]MBP2335103.1 putative DNA-binding transcriptional regulator YafY [Saccharothrix coeruleofusca]